MTVVVAAFYKFVRIEDPPALRGQLLDVLQARDIKGTLLIATEGINGTMSGKAPDMASALSWLRADPRFHDLSTRDGSSAEHPFERLKVKVKPEIISFRRPEGDPSIVVGTYVAPEQWNALISDPEVLVIDTRNAYEVAVGTFAGAIDPKTRRFGEFPDFVAANLDPARHRKVAMFCTGGIRCEKASAYMKSIGFPEVYHLQGGILGYLERIPPEHSLWHGQCFVFDERGAVDHTSADLDTDEDAQ